MNLEAQILLSFAPMQAEVISGSHVYWDREQALMPDMQISVHLSKSESWEIIHGFVFLKYENRAPWSMSFFSFPALQAVSRITFSQQFPASWAT